MVAELTFGFVVDAAVGNCAVTNTCTSVTFTNTAGVEQTDSDISCDDFMTDLVFDGNPTDGKFAIIASSMDYMSGREPGEYKVAVTGTVDDSGNSAVQELIFNFVDDCDEAVITTVPLVDQDYIGYTASSYDAGSGWTILPEYCELEYSQSAETFSNVLDGTTDNNAVTGIDSSTGVLSFYFEADNMS